MALKSQSKSEYDQHLTAKPATGMVSLEKKEKGSEWKNSPAESQVVVPGLFDSNGMSITVGGGQTLNLGNYESARIDVHITVPCSPTSLNEAYDWALAWCAERIQASAAEAKGV